MTSPHRSAWRRAARSKPKPAAKPLTGERFIHAQQAYLAALERLPEHLSSPAAKLPVWSPLVLHTVRNFINKTRLVDDFEAELRSHPGVPSELRSEALLTSLIIENWNICSYLRTNGVAALSWLPDEMLSDLGLADDNGIRVAIVSDVLPPDRPSGRHAVQTRIRTEPRGRRAAHDRRESAR